MKEVQPRCSPLETHHEGGKHTNLRGTVLFARMVKKTERLLMSFSRGKKKGKKNMTLVIALSFQLGKYDAKKIPRVDSKPWEPLIGDYPDKRVLFIQS